MAGPGQDPNPNDVGEVSEKDEDPNVPDAVLRGIVDVEDGNTASKADLDAALDF